MDHVRGSSLASPAALETLRPFVLTWWSGRTVEDMPPDVRAAHAAGGFGARHLNLGLVVLDSTGKVVRSYLPRVQPPGFGFDPEAQGRDFKWQLDDMLAGVQLPTVKAKTAPRLTLPDVTGPGRPAGARIYLTFAANRLNHYRTPTVEAVALTGEAREALRYPEAAREVPVTALRAWLEQMYPPAIMDGRGGFRSITGNLRLQPAEAVGEKRYAVLQGRVTFVLDNTAASTYTGELAVAVEYGTGAEALSFRGVLEADVPKGPERIRMTAAIESRPE
jgi:hypothetical protein